MEFLMTSGTEENGRQQLSGNYEEDSFETWPSSESSSSSSRALRFAGDTYESCSTEFERTKSYRSESFNSFCSVEGFDSQRERLASSERGYEDEKFEQYNENKITAEEEFSRKRIQVLRNKASPSSPSQKQRSNILPQKDVRKLGPDERDALKLYCRTRIRNVQQQQKPNESGCSVERSMQKAAGLSGEHLVCVIPQQVFERLRLKSFTAAMKKGIEAKMHQPSRCHACQNKRADLARDTFIRIKKNQLESLLLKEKIEGTIYTKGSVCLVGEVLKDLPKLSDDPSKIWRALIEKEQTNTLKNFV
ncbi:uncharacterized protein C8orf48 isoform X1 [Lepisosteus oculatus]|uniref:uncharacterized protein C8orf48 isoform X1 n=1 Tax=Lepisosteus oculatus TaxID=7918 RepID=UPI00371D7952